MTAPGGRRTRTRRVTLWNALLGALLLGAVAILGIFRLYIGSTGWRGPFPWSVYASAAAAWGVAVLDVVATMEVFGAVRIGAPRAAALRRPWVPFAALLLGLALGYLFWR